MPASSISARLSAEGFGSFQRMVLRTVCLASAGVTCIAHLNASVAGTPSDPWPGTKATNAVPVLARPLPLSSVRLTGGPLKHAQDLDAEYLLKLDIDRMMAGYRVRAGLSPKREGYGGWDAVNGKQLTGHIAGHYLSAVSYMYAATGDDRFKDRADTLVRELKEVQDKRGNGYLGAITDGRGTDGEILFEQVSAGDIRSGGFDLNGMWSPWYTLHKTFAGLRDAYRLTGNRTALDCEIRFAEWADKLLSRLDQAQIQRMLNTEFGGMNEVMADLYGDTGDPRWLKACDYFEHHAIVDPLANDKDILGGTHGNTQVPKLLGDLKRFLYTANPTNGEAASFFWNQVVFHHSFATGGHGHDEYFGPPDKLSAMVDGRTDESCNVYNMLKMTRLLFALRPDAKYAEFQERALFNHVLGSIDPQDGRTCYMVPVGRGVTHEYQDLFQNFTCCIGTGMENHALHGDGVYYESGDRLWVTVYTPSTAEWRSHSVKLETTTDFPEGNNASLRVRMKSPANFALCLRRPAWCEGFAVTLNGKRAAAEPCIPGFVQIQREWRDGDTVTLSLPKRLTTEPLPDNPNRVAILWGPLVLAGDLGPEPGTRGENSSPSERSPVLVARNQPVDDWLRPVAGNPGEFRTHGVGRDRDVVMEPFYRLHRRSYTLYWDLLTPEEWTTRAAELAAEKERQKALETSTVVYVQPGEMQPERDFLEQGEETQPERIMGRAGRRGSKWFSFDLPLKNERAVSLVVTYFSGERRKRTFDILADGQKIAEQVVEKSEAEPHFFDVIYPIDGSLTENKQKLTIKFQATKGNAVAGVFGLRLIRAGQN